MDGKLVLTVLCVTLSWLSLAADATNHTTALPNMNSTDGLTNATMPVATTNASMPVATTNASMPVATTNASAPATTMMTDAPPLAPNNTVVPLGTVLTRAECGTKQLCASEPSECDPSVAGSCFFLSAKQLSGQNFAFGLSGESEGYIAATLSPDTTVGDNDTTYVCANNNSQVLFFSARLLDGKLEKTELNVNSVKGSVNGSRIQCTFSATVETARARAAATTLAISTGTFSNGVLGSPEQRFRGTVSDLANTNATVVNELNSNATAAPTTAHGVTFQQSLMQALLITMGALGLFVV